MVLALLLSLAAADTHVPMYVKDPQYTKAPFEGLERLYVDPAATVAQVKPLASRPAGERVADKPGTGTLVYTNPMNQWAELTINGTKVGTIGPYATCNLAGFGAGWYQVDAWVSTGLTRHFAVEVK